MNMRSDWMPLAFRCLALIVFLSINEASATGKLYSAMGLPENFTAGPNYVQTRMAVLADGTIFKYSTCESYFTNCSNDPGSTGKLAEVSVWDSDILNWQTLKTPDFMSGGYTSTLLHDGRIILTGGETSLDTSTSIATTSVYDSRSQTFSTGPRLHEARSMHTATELSNGDVLIAGGETADVRSLRSAELISGSSIRILPPMFESRSFHTATRLQSGDVLVVGGRSLNQSLKTTWLASVERYVVNSNQWLKMPPLPSPRISHSATLLSDGKVLIVGGEEEGGTQPLCHVSRSVFLWDPAAEQWSAASDLPKGRAGHSATSLLNGDVLVSGGFDDQCKPILDLLLWSHASGQWQDAGHAHSPVSRLVTLMRDGNVFLGSDQPDGELEVWVPEPIVVATGKHDTSIPNHGHTDLGSVPDTIDWHKTLGRSGEPFSFLVERRAKIKLQVRDRSFGMSTLLAMSLTGIGFTAILIFLIFRKRSGQLNKNAVIQ